MQAYLVVARALHFAATLSLAGALAFDCLVAEPAFRRSGVNGSGVALLRRRFAFLAWASLGLALISGAAWLLGVASELSGQPLTTVLSQDVIGTVLTRTRFGEDWLTRSACAGLLALCLAARPAFLPRRSALLDFLALGLAAVMLASLAWAGHGAATVGAPGELHLAGDILHLLAAGLWLGTLPPFVLLLAAALHAGDAGWTEVARVGTRRFSTLAVGSVLVLLASGSMNTWFLAGTLPALVGTEYGRLLLTKIALFLAMLVFASVNLLRLTPRLSRGAAAAQSIGQLRRNALIETALGLGVLGVVGVLGLLPPGLHTEPGWPFPYRIDIAALTDGSKIALIVVAVVFCPCAVGAVAAAAAARYRGAAGFAGGIVLAAAVAWVPLAPAIERAYPTSFYAPAQPYNAGSVAAGAALYAGNCAACHGAGGEGNGPAAAGLSIRPANLTEPHLFAHTPGDLFWWVSEGRGHGAMPGFAAVMSPDQRWDVINFIRARAAGVLAREIGPSITSTAAYQVPDFAFETGGYQQTLSGLLTNGPALLMLFGNPNPVARFRELLADRSRLDAAGLQLLAVDLDEPSQSAFSEEGGPPPFLVSVAPEVKSVLTLYRSPADGGESELLLDRGGNIRARWTVAKKDGLPDAAMLAADAEAAGRFAVAAPSHAGHVH